MANWCRAELAGQDDGPEGYAYFYHLVFGRPLPEHARREWLPAIYNAHHQRCGVVIEAFRGSGKTTSLSIGWVAFRIGHRPEASNLVIQVSDAAAVDTCQQIADLIAHNPGWQAVFRHVRPDTKQGWGMKGYEVQRTDLPYDAWREQCAQTKGKDPTLLGVGYKSSGVIGKHPTGVLLIDDLHDEHNTRSAKELEAVRQVTTGTILPTATPETWQVVVGTPWVVDDVLATLKNTGRYLTVHTPVVRAGKPVWPGRFSLEEIELRRQESGEMQFARMYLLDLAAAQGMHLRRDWLNIYPRAKLSPDWPVVMGVDYASTADRVSDAQRDFFAIAIGRALPVVGLG